MIESLRQSANDWAPVLLGLLTLVVLAGVPLRAWAVRGRRYAIFGGVVLAVALPGALVAHLRLADWVDAGLRPWMHLAFAYGLCAIGIHMGALMRARLRHPVFRLAISIPAQASLAAGALSGVWLLALLPIRGALTLLGFHGVLEALRVADALPFAVAALSLVTSVRLIPEVVRVELEPHGPEEVERIPVKRYRLNGRRAPAPLERRALRIVQIADPHLGPWQPLRKLVRRIEWAVEQDPDLVLLTGDFLTMEGQGTPGALAQAFAPLRAISERCYAIFGNHDHESPEEVRSALAANGIRLLVDDEARVETPIGRVQIVGADWVSRERESHLRALLARFPRPPDHLRILLLHDPLGFQHVPKGEADLTLSGHTHGGQVGLVSLGLDWTVLSRSAWPDHGLFGHGSNRLYVHRGTGFYGFPLRIGVPGEASVLEVFT